MIKLLLDTDYLIDYLRGQLAAKELVANIRKRRIEGYLSVISLYELYIGMTPTSEAQKKLQEILTMKNWFFTLILGEQAMYQAAKTHQYLKSKNRTVTVKDIFIAATAISHNLPLKTRNKKDFQHIPELKLA